MLPPGRQPVGAAVHAASGECVNDAAARTTMDDAADSRASVGG